MIEILKAVLFGIIEGITEWLPVSSTGHMILLNELVKLKVSAEFYDMFQVVIQLGAILAVVVIFWNKLWPFMHTGIDTSHAHERNPRPTGIAFKPGALMMWLKIIAACIPAAIVGVLFDDKIDELFYHPVPVALALIIVGVAFILVENKKKGMTPLCSDIDSLSFKYAVIIGLFQLIAAVFPGTSRSGATIIGALIIGVSRQTAAEFTFFLAVPVMLGASLLKVLKFALAGVSVSGMELLILVIGTAVAYGVSILVIRFLMDYIKKHDFKVFGYYRIALGLLVILYFAIAK